MSKKQIMKKVFDKEFNINVMRSQILKKNERKIRMFKIVKYALPIWAILIIGSIFIFNNNNNSLLKLNNSNKEDYKNIVVNKIDNLGAVDADIKTMHDKKINISELDNLSIPNDLNISDKYSIYSRKDKTSDYNILNCYVYEYYKEDSLRSIRIAFSDKNKPIRDYYFSEEKAKKSKINNNELTIYQYEKNYFIEFKYKDYNFDIETSNISLEELTNLLETIIK